MEFFPHSSTLSLEPRFISTDTKNTMNNKEALRMTSIEANLLQAIEEIQARSQIQACLNDLAIDVEIATSLQEKCNRHFEKKEYESRIQDYENALQEVFLLQREERKKSKLLGKQLSKELVDLSVLLGQLKRENEQIAEKLAKTEEELKAAQTSQEPPPPESSQDQEASTKTIEHRNIVDETEQRTDAGQPTLISDQDSADSPVAPQEPKPAQEQVHTEPLVTLDENAENDTPNLISLETEILMRIFGFLDALDILNTAQVNVSMYSRVDSLFGFSPQAQSEDTSTIATSESNPTTTTVPPATESSNSKTVSKTPAPSASATKSDVGRGGLFAALLQPRKAGSPGRPARRSGSDISTSQPMNAAVASSMASKLTDTELNAIIVMTERLKQKETLADKLVKENEELKSKLNGTESVKQYLIERVREMEMAMDTSDENETKIAQQIASDQEVIAFLDGRVQDLERNVTRLENEKKEIACELQKLMEQSEQKSNVMGDMLQFEREKLSESEKEWKATKKVLVREVKSCRAQVAALQAERDGYREQNERLRKTVFLPERSYT